MHTTNPYNVSYPYVTYTYVYVGLGRVPGRFRGKRFTDLPLKILEENQVCCDVEGFIYFVVDMSTVDVDLSGSYHRLPPSIEMYTLEIKLSNIKKDIIKCTPFKNLE